MGTLPTSKGYAGQRQDVSSGLGYDAARYYDASTAQFASADTASDAGNGLDRLAYVGGNPETLTDPTGHSQYCGTDCGGSGTGGNPAGGNPNGNGGDGGPTCNQAGCSAGSNGTGDGFCLPGMCPQPPPGSLPAFCQHSSLCQPSSGSQGSGQTVTPVYNCTGTDLCDEGNIQFNGVFSLEYHFGSEIIAFGKEGLASLISLLQDILRDIDNQFTEYVDETFGVGAVLTALTGVIGAGAAADALFQLLAWKNLITTYITDTLGYLKDLTPTDNMAVEVQEIQLPLLAQGAVIFTPGVAIPPAWIGWGIVKPVGVTYW